MFKLKHKELEINLFILDFYNKICYAILGLGIYLVKDSFNINIWERFVIILNNESQSINFNKDTETNCIELILGVIFIITSIIIFLLKSKYELWSKVKYPLNLLAIKHQGLKPINLPDFNQKVACKDFRRYEVRVITIDEIDHQLNGNYQEAITNQDQKIIDIESLKNSFMHHELAYWGISRIPLTFRLGTKLSDTQKVHVFDYKRDEQKWNQLSYCKFKNLITKPKLFTFDQPIIQKSSSQDVILSISVSFNISKDDCLEVIQDYYKFYNLKLPNIENGKRDRFKTIKEINALSKQFRKILDEIKENSNIKTIHLFYAGPNSLAFKFGTMISESIHPNIRVYNYNKKDEPCFSWAYDYNNDNIIFTNTLV
ncbi:SAVED domain-containing protein [Flammeovirga sp. EKP202]|uniref:SAVED domain-containing protein n=1 Tax=Flammeovirga sp. EKP202 TaxID=2770592 RepID=UPI00165FD3C3|nr:SAVED domain-containing protein [Flammeovirga sp. EKP202]MBD0405294.1 SAVED domain-containing protein [Flammeovirga sp. EKP202]